VVAHKGMPTFKGEKMFEDLLDPELNNKIFTSDDFDVLSYTISSMLKQYEANKAPINTKTSADIYSNTMKLIQHHLDKGGWYDTVEYAVKTSLQTGGWYNGIEVTVEITGFDRSMNFWVSDTS
jgi:hypothetical protein